MRLRLQIAIHKIAKIEYSKKNTKKAIPPFITFQIVLKYPKQTWNLLEIGNEFS